MSVRMTTSLAAATALFLGVVASGGARAEAIDYVALFKKDVIKCLHATVDPAKAQVEISKDAVTDGDVTTVRLKTFYDGLLKKNSMETELMVRQSGTIRQMKIKVLSDTGTSVFGCALEKNWKDF
jgi:hypothetical protein